MVTDDKQKVQEVKLKGFLWTTKLLFSILRDALIIVLIIALLASVILMTPIVIKLSGSLGQVAGAFSGENSQNALGGLDDKQGDSRTGLNEQYRNDDSKDSVQSDDLLQAAEGMRQAVEWSDWSGAMEELNALKQSTQLTETQKRALEQMENAINNRDKESFLRIYKQALQQ